MPDDRPLLVLGPMLRHADADSATLWVETDRPCEVRVRCGEVTAGASTWGVHGHHYALVVLQGLVAGTATDYTVELDEDVVWPERPERSSTVRTPVPGSGLRLAFGSCRKAEAFDEAGLAQFGADALAALATRMLAQRERSGLERWPDLLLFVGDQIYADEPSEELQERLRERRAAGFGPPGAAAGTPAADDPVTAEICDFEEYTWLYREAWSAEDVRWLLSSVPTCMILDDHDLRDDWNSSHDWRTHARQQPWWRDRVVGAFSSYWVYQHLGNLSPHDLEADELYRAVRAAGSDAEREALLADFSWRADTEPGTARWSYHRDLGPARLLVIDSRCSRRLDPDDRSMLDDTEWAWVRDRALDTDAEHLLLATSLPFLMLPALHHLEGWNEATAQGAWGRAYAAVAEKVRLTVDLEHWAAFRSSFDAVVGLVQEVAAAERPPASVLFLSGDVHCSYVADARVQGVDPARTVVAQLTMSPLRNPLNVPIRMVNRLARQRGVGRALRALSRRAGVTEPAISWDVEHGPWFDNGVMTVALEGRTAAVEVEHAWIEPTGAQALRRTHDLALTGSGSRAH